jgi:hypothetical protein
MLAAGPLVQLLPPAGESSQGPAAATVGPLHGCDGRLSAGENAPEALAVPVAGAAASAVAGGT